MWVLLWIALAGDASGGIVAGQPLYFTDEAACKLAGIHIETDFTHAVQWEIVRWSCVEQRKTAP